MEATEIRPGDVVECLHNWYDAAFACPGVTAGARYHVSVVEADVDPGCEIHGDKCHAPGLILKELPGAYWCAAQFKRALNVVA